MKTDANWATMCAFLLLALPATVQALLLLAGLLDFKGPFNYIAAKSRINIPDPDQRPVN